jgi:hypothetical protein
MMTAGKLLQPVKQMMQHAGCWSGVQALVKEAKLRL